MGGTRKIKIGDFNKDLQTNKPSSAGLGDEKTSIAENELADKLHNLGVRVRLPVLGLLVDKVLTVDGERSVEELVEQGILKADFLENKPMVVYYARRNPYTFADAADYIKEGGKPDDLLRSQAQYLRRENTKEANRVADLIENGSPEAMKEWFGWLAKTFGKQMSLWAKIGFLHPSFHGQNMTLAVETGDTGDDSEKFKLKPILEVRDEDTKIDFADQGFSAIYFMTSLLNDMGKMELEEAVIENFVSGLCEQKDEAMNVLVTQMLTMLKKNETEESFLTKCLQQSI